MFPLATSCTEQILIKICLLKEIEALLIGSMKALCAQLFNFLDNERKAIFQSLHAVLNIHYDEELI